MSIPPPPPRRPGPSLDQQPTQPVPTAPRSTRRAAPRPVRRGPSTWVIGGVVLVIVALVAGAVVVLGGGDKKDEVAELDTSTTVDLTITDPVVASVNPFATPGDVPSETSQIVLGLVEDYANAATVVPLRKGVAKDSALADLFDDPAMAALAAGDRALLVDEGLPKAVGKVTVTAPAIGFTALMGDGGNVVLANAAIDLTITAQAKKGEVTIRRTGSLVLSPQLDNSWKITAWTLRVERSGAGSTASSDLPTTTVAS